MNVFNNLVVMFVGAGLFCMLRRLLSLLSTISSWPRILPTVLLCLRESRPLKQLQMRTYRSLHVCTVAQLLIW